MATVRLRGVGKRFGETEVLHDIDLDIAEGEFIVLVGPSGCGKSTLLRMIAGLERTEIGTIEIDGECVNELAPPKRDIAMVFQNYALYPHMNVRDNLGFSLSMQHADEAERERRIADAARFLGLEDYLDRRPASLSGGQRQRVAIGRAMVRKPKVFLFDEPLSNLDAALRVATRREIRLLNDRLPHATMVYVTHDQIEAMTLADRIVVLSADGGIQQVGTADELYRFPSNVYVAHFVGSPAMNLLPASLDASADGVRVTLAGHPDFALPLEPGFDAPSRCLLGVRPEHLHLAGEHEDVLLTGTIVHVEYLGEATLLYVDGGLDEEPLVVKLPGTRLHIVDDRVRLSADAEHVHLFDGEGEALGHTCPGSASEPSTASDERAIHAAADVRASGVAPKREPAERA